MTDSLMNVKSTGLRTTVLLLGEQDWGLTFLAASLKALPREEVVWVSAEEAAAALAQRCLKPSQVRQLLGQEFLHAVVDLHSGFNPDVLAVVAGTVRGGGTLFLLAPELAQWQRFADPEYDKLVVHPYRGDEVLGRYLRRFKAQVLAMSLEEGRFHLLHQRQEGEALKCVVDEVSHQSAVRPFCLTVEQEAALAEIRKLAASGKKQALVITADRGRGKSTVLGVAAAALLQQKALKILIIAPQFNSAAAVVSHCCEALSGAGFGGDQQVSESDPRQPLRPVEWKNNQVVFGAGCLVYVAADEVLARRPAADLVFVDEAAALPTFMLSGILSAYKRVVFSTTIHGYEGNGQGFRLRFCRTLDQQVPRWRSINLTEPVRWGREDPLERFVYRSLMLDAQPAEVDETFLLDARNWQTVRLERDALVENEARLRELMGLLRIAHYRTTPGDLRSFLDCPNFRLYAVCGHQKIIAAAVVAEEGGFEASWLDPIWLGQRRLRGHLLPQSLSQQLGFREGPTLRCGRVVRIAVHPALQGRGVGSQLLQQLTEALKAEAFDYVGASFAVTAQVLRFWQKNQFVAIRVGVSKEKSSGCHAGLVVRPLSDSGVALAQVAQQRFLAQLPLALDEYLGDVGAELMVELLASGGQDELEAGRGDFYGGMDAQDCLDVEAFIQGQRNYETCLLALRKKVFLNLHCLKAGGGLSLLERNLLVKKVIQKESWPSVVRTLPLNGKKPAQQLLRQAVAKLNR